MLLITAGCGKEGNGGGKPTLKTTEIGDGLINSYRAAEDIQKLKEITCQKKLLILG